MEYKEMREYDVPSVRCNTPHGDGVIERMEFCMRETNSRHSDISPFYWFRFLVKLDKNPFPCEFAAYREWEIIF